MKYATYNTKIGTIPDEIESCASPKKQGSKSLNKSK